MTTKPPTEGAEIHHLHAFPKPPDTVRRVLSGTPPDPKEPGHLSPRVSMDVRGGAVLQMVLPGVEFVADRVEHEVRGGRLRLTLSGPLRSTTGAPMTAEGAARIAAEVEALLRGKGG